MRLYVFLFTLIVGLTFLPVRAQDAACNPNLSQVMGILERAQDAIDGGDIDAAVGLMAEARNELALQEATCTNYAPETAGDRRTNPVPFGERKSFVVSGTKTASIQLVGYIDNANDYSLVPIPDDKRLVAIEFDYYCEGSPDERCSVSGSQYSLVGSLNTQYSRSATSLPNARELTLFGGGQGTYAVGYLVGIDETDFVFSVSNLTIPTFFATQ